MSALIMVGEPEPHEIAAFESEVFASVCEIASEDRARIPEGFGLEAVLESRRFCPDSHRDDEYNVPPDDSLRDYRSLISLRLRIGGHDVQRGGMEDRSEIDIVSVKCSVFGSRMVYYIDRFELRAAVSRAIDELCDLVRGDHGDLDFVNYYDLSVFPPRCREVIFE